jgi:hypothetical protein
MTWILSATGREVDMRTSRIDHVSLQDIAHSLSQINRFTGHAARPYSVAEHSLLVAEIIRDVLRAGPEAQLAGLMHDAHEAYTGDMHTPGKAEIGPDWRLFEGRWERTVRRALGLEFAFLDHAALVKQADLIALATERRDLMPPQGAPWQILQGITPHKTRLMTDARIAMPWTGWRDEFIHQFNLLEAACGRTTSTLEA